MDLDSSQARITDPVLTLCNDGIYRFEKDSGKFVPVKRSDVGVDWMKN